MKTLYIARHAKSDWSVEGAADFDRPLNSRGLRVSPKMSRILKDYNAFPDLVVCSSAVRTRETAKYLCESINVEEDDIKYIDDIYEAATGTLLELVNKFDDSAQSALMIGHNPGVSYLTEYLSEEYIDNMPTCSVVKLIFEIDSWTEVSKGIATLDWFIYPKKFDF